MGLDKMQLFLTEGHHCRHCGCKLDEGTVQCFDGDHDGYICPCCERQYEARLELREVQQKIEAEIVSVCEAESRIN